MTEFVTVCKVDEIEPGEREIFGINDTWVAVFNVDGEFYAIEDRCTHDDNSLAEDGPLDGYSIACTRHWARFDIRTGKVLAGPALVDVPRFEVRVTGDEVQVEVP